MFRPIQQGKNKGHTCLPPNHIREVVLFSVCILDRLSSRDVFPPSIGCPSLKFPPRCKHNIVEPLKDTLGPATLSIVERLSSSWRFYCCGKSYVLLGRCEVSKCLSFFVRGCLLLGESFIRGSTIMYQAVSILENNTYVPWLVLWPFTLFPTAKIIGEFPVVLWSHRSKLHLQTPYLLR